ncbi:MAG TPA: DUF1566 domain-containing protein [Myxococcota bacterium]|nr:DUF1566 domain-containing protein [Myxococcota bacterium]
MKNSYRSRDSIRLGVAGLVLLAGLGLAGCDSGSGSEGCSPNPCLNGGICIPQGGEISCVCIPGFSGAACDELTGYLPIVDTGQSLCYDESNMINCPVAGQTFFGQDAQYTSVLPAYRDNGDGTVTDLNTGLMWQQDPGEKLTNDEAVAGAAHFDLAGYDDWRLPTIKELYSLILFSGIDPSGYEGTDTSGMVPFIDTDYFVFEYGDPTAGERIIDAQFTTSTRYVSTTMNGDETVFGVNFADGRIKGYGTGPMPGQTTDKTFFVLYVRRDNDPGETIFTDNGDGTVTDQTTGLLWQQDDSDLGLNWEGALAYCESLDLANHSDWKLPNAKELQSIIDYSRSPDTTGSAAIDPVFSSSSITNEAGNADFPNYWTGTTHANRNNGHEGESAVYVSFGRALGYMNNQWIDVHGAGAQRSDPKEGDPADWPMGRGPQGDAIRIFNYVRCVRNNSSSLRFR